MGRPLAFDRKTAIDVAAQISQGLAKAHSKEIIHRDCLKCGMALEPMGVPQSAGKTEYT